MVIAKMSDAISRLIAIQRSDGVGQRLDNEVRVESEKFAE
jgi:hypothetical protein